MLKKFNLSQFTSGYRSKLIIETYKKWLKPTDKVIDLGCGTGVISKQLSKKLGINITGCDIKNYLIYDLPFISIKNNKLPFPDKSIDAILLNDVLHHIKFKVQKTILEESSRVGKKVLIFEAEPTKIGKLADLILNKIHYDDLNIPLSFRSIKDWQLLFKTLPVSYKTIKIKRSFWYPFSHIAFLLESS